jgi:hypothetical protein
MRMIEPVRTRVAFALVFGVIVALGFVDDGVAVVGAKVLSVVRCPLSVGL